MDIEYKEAVSNYAKDKKDYLFHNLGNEQAIVIFENIFKNANGKVRMAINDFWRNETVNSFEFKEGLRLFLEREGTSLDIILSSFPSEEIRSSQSDNIFRLLYSTRAYNDGRIRIRLGGGKSFTVNNAPVHFCTADGHMYRFEEDIRTLRATCNFYDPATTQSLDNAFDAVFNSDVMETINLGEVLR